MPPNDPTFTHTPQESGDSSEAAWDVGMAAAFGPVGTSSYHPAAEPEAGTILAGKYRLSERIGEGGMGSVWVAHQSEPVKRKVAVKLIKAGMDSKSVLARFEAERQALAVMDHPNIAKVLDGGLHEGRPFFVMELVKGVPITEYCDARKLTPKERLELFVSVCQAIQHAHQKGIIHRDIKPSNVLVALYDDKPVPKVIDFGVAKATGGTLTEQTIETAFGGVVGTPQYMSPEQASLNNLDIDTRSDVYSLGVLLYELLTGSPPFARKELEKKGLLEILRVVREEEPPRPSTKLSTADALPSLSANRGTEPKKLTGLLRNELDWIVMKALEKDRARRYETANGFAADVNRYLCGEAVQAHPPSTAYRVKKFVRRNRLQVISGAVVLAVLLAGIAGTSLGLVRAEQKRVEAEQAKDEAEAEKKKAIEFRNRALDALRATTGKDVEKLLGEKKDLTANEKAYLEAIAERWQEFAQQEGADGQSRAIRAEGHYRVASLWARLGRLAEARPEYERAIALYEKLDAEIVGQLVCRQLLAEAHSELGVMLGKLGLMREAEPHFRKVIAIREVLASDYPGMPKLRGDLARCHNNLAVYLNQVGRTAAAEEECLKGLAINKDLVTRYPDITQVRSDLAFSHHTLGAIHTQNRNWNDAEDQYRKSLTIREQLVKEFETVPEYKADLVHSYINLGEFQLSQKKWSEVEEPTRKGLAISTQLAAEYPNMPEYQLNLAQCYNHLGITLSYLKKQEQAEKAYRQGLAVREKLVADYPKSLTYRLELGGDYCNFGSMVSRRGQFTDSLPWYEKAISTLRPVYEKEPEAVTARDFLTSSHVNRGVAYALLEQYPEALSDWETAIKLSPPDKQLKYRVFRAVLWAHTGRVNDAVEEMTTLLKRPGWNAFQLYDFACGYSIASGKVPDKQIEYADTAMALLHQAVKGGVRDIKHMKTDRSLAPLRERDDFKKLFADLETKYPPKKEAPPQPRVDK